MLDESPSMGSDTWPADAHRLAGGVWFVSLPSLEKHLAEKEARKNLWRDHRRSEHASFA